jgi:hypothetical protein
MPDALMGFALQSFVPLVQPCIVSDAVALMALGTPARLATAPVCCRLKRARASRSESHETGSACLTFKALLHTRSRHLTAAVYTAKRRLALLSFSPPGFSPSLEWRGFHRASPHVVSTQGASDPRNATPGSCFQSRLACLSRDCRPSWGSSPSDRAQ